MDGNDPFNATLIEREDLTRELAVFRIKYDEGEVPDFAPGQFTTLGMPPDPSEVKPVDPNSPRARRNGRPRLIRRAYSIASSPNDRDYLEFYLIVVDEGKLTPKLWAVEPGQRLFMDRRMSGHFTLNDVPEGKDLIMIATGTGLAPFVSMIKTYRGTGRWRKCVLIHGTRLCNELGYRQELEQLAGEDDSIIYIPTCTREPSESAWDGLRGRIHVALEPDRYEQLVGAPLSAEQCHVFLCGNPAMIDQCEEDLQQRGFVVKDRNHPDGNIHFERYW